MFDDPDTFTLRGEAFFPNVFAPIPNDFDQSRPPLYCLSMSMDSVVCSDPEQMSRIAERFATSSRWPGVRFNASSPPPISVDCTPFNRFESYRALKDAVEIAKARNLYLDRLMIGMKVTATVCWYEFPSRSPASNPVRQLSLRGINLDQSELLRRVLDA